MKQIRIFLRSLKRDKITSSFSVLSLSIGLSLTILIGSWCLNEFSFDKFHKDHENIYRVCRKGFIDNESVKIGSVFRPLGVELSNTLPEVEDMVRIFDLGESVAIVENKTFYQDGVCAVDTNFFNLFNFQLKLGSIESFINKPNSILINEKLAVKYFPKESPIGKSISLNGQREIVGVLYNCPTNTHLDFNALVPMHSVGFISNMNWGNNDGFQTYVKLVANSNVSSLEKTITQIARSKFPPYGQIDIKHFLQPLASIHFSEGFRFDGVKKSSLRLVLTIALIGIIVMILACVNFINLSISSSYKMAGKIGVKKTFGAKKTQLIREFFLNTFVLIIFSVIIGLIAAQLLLPLFSSFIDYQLSIAFNNPAFYLMLLAIVFFTTILSCTFPSFHIASYNTINTLKGKIKGQNFSSLQKSLVILQFSASIILITTIVIIRQQVNFVNNADLGFNKEGVVYFHLSNSMIGKYKLICQELEKSPYVKKVSVKNGTPFDWSHGNGLVDVEKPDDIYIAELCNVSANYFDMMEMELIEGEAPLTESDPDNYCVINEKACQLLGYSNPIDKQIRTNNRTYIVKGVVKDSYTKSLHQDIDPQVYLKPTNIHAGYVLMAKATDDLQPVISLLEQQWNKYNPNLPFVYHFLDKEYEQLYKAEVKTSKTLAWATITAIVLTVIGLWGMALYAISRRVKEIGVRKVNGAKITEILAMLNSQFVKWVLISFIISVPISLFATRSWLQSFVMRTPVHWWIFALAGVLALGIALLTVSWQSWRAATRNPVEALRYE